MRAVRLLRVDVEGFFADCGANAPPQHVSVIVLHLPEWPPIDHSVLLIPTWPFLALVRHHRHAAKFYPFDGAPWLFLALEDRDAVEAGFFESFQKEVLSEST